jgi:predicted ATP-dependent serine protease
MQKNITTGFEAINDVLGGGLTKGSLCEIYGDEGVGKTSVAISISTNHAVGFIDMDRSLPARLVEWMGDPNNMVVSYPPEGGLGALIEIVELLAKNVEVVVIDPVGVMEWRDMEQFLPSAAQIASIYNSIVLLINHSNQLGVPNGQQWTSFYCAQRVEMRQGDVQFDRETGQSESMSVLVRTTKNAHGPNFRESEMSFQFKEEPIYV